MKTSPNLILTLLVTSSCASVSHRYPTGSAASPQAVEAPSANVTTVLAGDPPLPGEPAGAWKALDEEAPRALPDGGAALHHHGH